MPQIHQNTKSHKKEHIPISAELEEVGKNIVHACYCVHRELGPGLLEKVYEICLAHELSKIGLNVKRQIDIPIVYDQLVFEEGLRLDLLVEDKIICEIKAVDTINPVWEAQVLSHLKLANKRLGYLINFNVPNIGQGIKRFIK